MLEVPNLESTKNISKILLESSLGYFLKHPFIFGGLFIGLVFAVGSIASIMFDRGEGHAQEGLWTATICILIYFGILLTLIFFDSTEIVIFNKLF